MAVEPDPVSDAPDDDDDVVGGKHVRKPSKKIANLLGGKGTWSTASRPALAPGVQQPTDDWTASVEECVDEHDFAAETSDAEALEP